MTVAQKEPKTFAGFPLEEILSAARSEPAVAWFLAQALWIAQPALEAFWLRERIEAIAESLESNTGPKDNSSSGPADGGTGM